MGGTFKMNGHGLVFDEITEDNWVLGGRQEIGGAVIRPDRDWRPYIPASQETQNRGFETQACSNFGTANALEILLNHTFKDTKDFSDRWFAKASGTSVAKGGNSPHTVAEYARNTGLVLESKWPFDTTIDTVDKFYADFPNDLYTEADKLKKEYKIHHEWVPLGAMNIYDALQYSPLGFSVHAWVKDKDGMYYRPQGKSDNHWCVCIYAELEKYWLVLDSYKDGGVLLKKVRWDAIPMMCKRYSITQTPHTFLKNLFFGMTDLEIPKLQKALLSLGYSIPNSVTDFYGNQTKSAVWHFQMDNGIVDSGANFGPRSRQALNKKLNPEVPFGGSFLTFIQSFLSST